MTQALTGKFKDWHDLIKQRKTVFDWPTWSEVAVVHESRAKAVAAGRQPFRSQVAQRTRMMVQFAGDDYVAIEGARVRLETWAHRPMDDVTATFEVLHAESWLCISRIDFIPPGPHVNKNWKKFAPQIEGSHIHRYDDNHPLGDEAFAPVGNLPNAVEIVSPDSFKELVKAVDYHFNIDGIDSLDAPEWNGRLL